MKNWILRICIYGPLLLAIQFLLRDAEERTPLPLFYESLVEDQANIVSMVVTAYCPCEICCGSDADGLTSRNDDAYICDGVAADPELIPYRTRLRIPGVGIREVDDTGGAMRQDAKRGIYHIDLRFPTHASALAWGVQQLNVEILEEDV